MMALRAVLDTNVLVSGLLATSGPPRQLFDAWLAGRFTLVTSLYQIEELRRVLTYPRIARRVRLTENELAILFRTFDERAVIVVNEPDLSGVTRDPKDDAIVACAVAGQADYLVSGDDDLLALGTYEKVYVVYPRAFLSALEQKTD